MHNVEMVELQIDHLYVVHRLGDRGSFAVFELEADSLACVKDQKVQFRTSMGGPK